MTPDDPTLYPNPIPVHSRLDDAGLSVYAFRIAGRIGRRWNAERGCDESVDNMAKGCGIDRKTAYAAIAELIERGVVVKTTRPGKPSRYDFAPIPEGGYLSRDTVHPCPAGRAIPPDGLSRDTVQVGVPPDGTTPVPPDGTQRNPSKGSQKRNPSTPTVPKGTGEGKAQKPKRKRKPKPEPVALPDWIDPDVWADWETHRREIGKTLKPTQVTYQIRKLDTLRSDGHDPNECIRLAVAGGWQGFYAPKRGGGDRAVGAQPATSAPAVRNGGGGAGRPTGARGADGPRLSASERRGQFGPVRAAELLAEARALRGASPGDDGGGDRG